MPQPRRPRTVTPPAEAPDMTMPSLGGEADPIGSLVVTETQLDRDARNRPVGAEPDVEERFRALQLTDERLQAEINHQDSRLDGHDEDIKALYEASNGHDRLLTSTYNHTLSFEDKMYVLEQQVLAIESSQSPRSDAWRRLSSRKFIMALVSFIGAIVGGLSGWIPPEVAAVLATASAALYGLAEAWVDNGTEKAKAEVAKAVATMTPPPH